MGFRDVALMPPGLVLPTHFLDIVAEEKASGSPHGLKLRLSVKKGMLPVKHFCSNKPLCQFYFMETINHTIEAHLATISFLDFTSICLSVIQIPVFIWPNKASSFALV